jgi:hypothetical protein
MSDMTESDMKSTALSVQRASVELERGGLCSRPGVDPDGWFPVEADHPVSERARAVSVERAWAQCRDEADRPCPVMATCLVVALARGERHGIWAGRPGWKLAERRRAAAVELMLDEFSALGGAA